MLIQRNTTASQARDESKNVVPTMKIAKPTEPTPLSTYILKNNFFLFICFDYLI